MIAAAAAITGVIWQGRTHPTSVSSGSLDCAGPVMRLGKVPGYNFHRQDPNHRPAAVVVHAGGTVTVGGRYYWDGCGDASAVRSHQVGPLKSVKITLTPGLARWRGPGDGLSAGTVLLGTAHPTSRGTFLVAVPIPADAHRGLAVLGDGGVSAGIAVRVR